jgi:Ca2+/H+ antiporter
MDFPNFPLLIPVAEILVDVVDVVLEGSGIDEKFLGVTLFALVPNTTEFMNAMAFALNGNIALRSALAFVIDVLT